ncbi:MAG: O-antigen ligase family protein [Rhizobiales bacterium]|nr:O-antigen ligase family protein [Hyphomicrobiales bacterium]
MARIKAIRLLALKPTKSLYPADILVVLVAATLPWSTSLPAILLVFWVWAMAPATDLAAFSALMRRPICYLPVGFFALALVGTLWSSAPWPTRLYSVGPLAKFLALPLLIHQFQRSSRGSWVFAAFFISCTCLMIYSWIVTIEPQLALKPNAAYGVPIKNYIDQSHEFALCMIGILYVVIQDFRDRRFLRASLLAVITLAFFANMAFVVVSRTAMVAIPFMIAAIVMLHLPRRATAAVIGGALVLVFAVWAGSPGLRERAAKAVAEYQTYKEANAASSVGLRLEFWRKSLKFWSETPLIGHGTGSVKSLFEGAAAGETGASAEIIANPHNQTLYAAVQWGLLGVLVLYGIWLSHLLLFRGASLAHWIGLLVVAQNVLTSTFNSHLFDFVPGWIYVLGVGVAGGMVTTSKAPPSRNAALKA